MTPIDIHAHLFNLRYLPVGGIIRRYSNNILSRRVCGGAEWFLWLITASSFDLDDDISNQVNPKANRHDGFSTEEVREMDEDKLAEKLTELAMSEDFVNTALGEALDEFEEFHPSLIAPDVKFSNRLNPLTPEEFTIAKMRFKGFWKWLMEKIEDGVDHIRWFIIMCNGEEYLFRQMSKDNKGINDYLHHLMDVDHFFADEENGYKWSSYYEFYPTQVKRMQKLQANHRGHLSGFVAFNPKRENAMEIIKDSLSLRFKGVKFYPPMNYKPIGDGDAVVAQRIKELIAFCIKGNVALFTHCNNNGFQAFPKKNSGYRSNPVFWEELLQKNKSLRLCLGHGGGGEGWFAEIKPDDHIRAEEIEAAHIKDSSDEQLIWNQSYAAMVFKLCVKYPNVYCDFSYLDDMINRDGTLDERKRINFRTRLLLLLKSQPEFANKIMYGSDWHMLYRENKHAVYFSVYKHFFDDAAFEPYRENFFAANAKRYVGL